MAPSPSSACRIALSRVGALSATPCQQRPGNGGCSKRAGVERPIDRTENKRLPVTIDPDPHWIIRDGDLLVVRGSGSPSAVGRRRSRGGVGQPAALGLASTAFRLLGRKTRRFVRPRFDLGTSAGNWTSIRTDVGIDEEDPLRRPAGVLVPAAPRSVQDAAIAALRRTEDRLAVTCASDCTAKLICLWSAAQALITAAVTGQIEIPGVAA